MNATWADLLPSFSVGATFTALGIAKFYGLAKGIEGGGKKPLGTRLCGS